MFLSDNVLRRLSPIYLAFVFKGLIFWYAIEKLFMTNIGFTPQTIAISVIIMGASGLLLEIPFGIIADRWSRKGVLILSVVALSLATLFMGLADSVPQYMLASVFFGAYTALFSGTVDSIVYDTLLEENGSRKGYERYYGYTNLIMSISLIIGSLIGGVIAVGLDLQAAYLLTLPSMAVAILILLFLKEPKLHKHQEDIKIIQHTKDTLGLIFKRGTIGWIILFISCVYIMLEIFFEMDQLWPIALAMPLALYGPVNALFLAGYGLGGPLADLMARKKFILWIVVVLAVICSSVLSIHSLPVAIIALSLGIVLFQALDTIGIGKLHDEMPSRYRSGAASAASTIGNIVMIPMIFLFGWIAEVKDVFIASYLMIPFTLLAIVSLLMLSKNKKSTEDTVA